MPTAAIENADPDESALFVEVAHRIRQARLQGKLTQQDLAERIQAKRQYIFELESGSANITLRTLHRLARAFGMSPGELLPSPTHPKLDIHNVRPLLERCEDVLALGSRHAEEHRLMLVKLQEELKRLASNPPPDP